MALSSLLSGKYPIDYNMFEGGGGMFAGGSPSFNESTGKYKILSKTGADMSGNIKKAVNYWNKTHPNDKKTYEEAAKALGSGNPVSGPPYSYIPGYGSSAGQGAGAGSGAGGEGGGGGEMGGGSFGGSSPYESQLMDYFNWWFDKTKQLYPEYKGQLDEYGQLSKEREAQTYADYTGNLNNFMGTMSDREKQLYPELYQSLQDYSTKWGGREEELYPQITQSVQDYANKWGGIEGDLRSQLLGASSGVATPEQMANIEKIIGLEKPTYDAQSKEIEDYLKSYYGTRGMGGSTAAASELAKRVQEPYNTLNARKAGLIENYPQQQFQNLSSVWGNLPSASSIDKTKTSDLMNLWQGLPNASNVDLQKISGLSGLLDYAGSGQQYGLGALGNLYNTNAAAKQYGLSSLGSLLGSTTQPTQYGIGTASNLWDSGQQRGLSKYLAELQDKYNRDALSAEEIWKNKEYDLAKVLGSKSSSSNILSGLFGGLGSILAAPMTGGTSLIGNLFSKMF